MGLNAGFLTVKKIFLIAILCILVFILGLTLWPKKKGIVYEDTINKVAFVYPETWKVNSLNGYIKLDSNPSNYLETNISVTINPDISLIKYWGLDKQAIIEIGDKKLQIVHKDVKVRDSDKVITFTYVYWEADDSHKYWFQVSPKQENGFSDEVKNFLISFSPNE